MHKSFQPQPTTMSSKSTSASAIPMFKNKNKKHGDTRVPTDNPPKGYRIQGIAALRPKEIIFRSDDEETPDEAPSHNGSVFEGYAVTVEKLNQSMEQVVNNTVKNFLFPVHKFITNDSELDYGGEICTFIHHHVKFSSSDWAKDWEILRKVVKRQLTAVRSNRMIAIRNAFRGTSLQCGVLLKTYSLTYYSFKHRSIRC